MATQRTQQLTMASIISMIDLAVDTEEMGESGDAFLVDAEQRIRDARSMLTPRQMQALEAYFTAGSLAVSDARYNGEYFQSFQDMAA